MNINMITKLACGKTGNYTLNADNKTKRDIYILTENKDLEDEYRTTKYHCIVIYNDIIAKGKDKSVEKIYVDSFYESDSVSWIEVLDTYEHRESKRLRAFLDEKQVKDYVNTLIKREDAHRKERLQFIDEKKEIKRIMTPLLDAYDSLSTISYELEHLDVATDYGRSLKEDAHYLIRKMNKISKRLGVSETEKNK